MKLRYFIALLIFAVNAYADEAQTSAAFNKIKNQPAKLEEFLYQFPKGGDLHNHLNGSVFAEELINIGKHDTLCVDKNTYSLTRNAACEPEYLLNNIDNHPELFNALISSWSMYQFVPGKETKHDHFFAAFGKYSLISGTHHGEEIAAVAKRAEQQNELYLELMMTIDGNASGHLGEKIKFNNDFDEMRNDLLITHKSEFDNIIQQMKNHLDEAENIKSKTLYCASQPHNPGCRIQIRYIYQVGRGQSPVMVFAQLLAGFEIASNDKRVVGLNMVQPEDGAVSMRDYKLHMQMVGFLHQKYPNVNITLHAGELNEMIATPEGLSFHINDAVRVAQAKRIGHGVDIIHEDNYQDLLHEMANRHILVEINLTSNDVILDISGKNHPLPLYLQYGVPVALSTDDEGVSRKILSAQYAQAVTDFGLTYATLKQLSRNSLTYSFLPGESLWKEAQYNQTTEACIKDKPGSNTKSAACNAFLMTSEKARLQWNLEKRFIDFEATHDK